MVVCVINTGWFGLRSYDEINRFPVHTVFQCYIIHE